MNVLALDAGSDILSVALISDCGCAEASLERGRSHAQRLMGLVDFCVEASGLKPAEIDLVACSKGPGSFTGLRIGMAAAKGIAFGLGRPWVAVPSLDCLAWGLDWFPGVVAPVLDAGRGRLYSALYLRGIRQSDWLDVSLARLASMLDTYSEALITGPDAELCRDLSLERSGFVIDQGARRPAARALASLGALMYKNRGSEAEDEGPLYVRPSEAEEQGGRNRSGEKL